MSHIIGQFHLFQIFLALLCTLTIKPSPSLAFLGPDCSPGKTKSFRGGTSTSIYANRRDVLSFSFASLAIFPSVSDALVEGNKVSLDTSDDTLPVTSYKKLPSGLAYADARLGTKGDAVAKAGDKVNLQWVLRKSNGYFVDSSAVAGDVPFVFVVGSEGGAIAGVDEGVRGMRAGGIRRLLIPPRLAYVDGLEDGSPGPVPVGYGPRQQMRRVMLKKDVQDEYLYLEVQLTRIR
uniref:peptidylprolyl isomerase n=1 Tax=Corethron hystrix TaxID=216773 RepID=A0A7S1BQK4_9STRA|mmetsp:Transcript_37349/g.87109  ORF Transcript_37349/g.87109 Transcript_37349/m.87109 type:complete len:234 (+) Transcript_37349:85-786(+)